MLVIHNILYAYILSYKATSKRYTLLYIWVV
nr:MAG TPA_asm: hypothetical protein [Caudoviricetes sp.]